MYHARVMWNRTRAIYEYQNTKIAGLIDVSRTCDVESDTC